MSVLVNFQIFKKIFQISTVNFYFLFKGCQRAWSRLWSAWRTDRELCRRPRFPQKSPPRFDGNWNHQWRLTLSRNWTKISRGRWNPKYVTKWRWGLKKYELNCFDYKETTKVFSIDTARWGLILLFKQNLIKTPSKSISKGIPIDIPVTAKEKSISKRQNHKDDCANFCGLLRKAELYNKKS